MSIFLEISTAVLLIGIILALINALDRVPARTKETIGVISGILIFCSVIFGFGVMGCLASVDFEKIEVDNFDVVSTQFSTIIDTEKKVKVMREKRHEKYSEVDKENLKVYYVNEYNSYGIKLAEETMSGDKIQVEIVRE